MGQHGQIIAVNTVSMKTEAELLKELGLTIPPDTVREAASHLVTRNSLYSLYQGKSALVAKATATKIRHLFREGKLRFLLDRPPEFVAIDRLVENAPKVAADSPPAPLAPPTYWLGVHPKVAREELDYFNQNADPVTKARWERTSQILGRLPDVDWSVGYLEAARIPKEEVLALLSEYDRLYASIFKPDGQTPISVIADRPGLLRFVNLHYLVSFSGANPGAPFDVVNRAAELYAQGLLWHNSGLQRIGLDILRYEIWRGGDYLRAFEGVLPKDFRPSRRRKLLSELRGLRRDGETS